jgi:hypothetical protein
VLLLSFQTQFLSLSKHAITISATEVAALSPFTLPCLALPSSILATPSQHIYVSSLRRFPLSTSYSSFDTRNEFNRQSPIDNSLSRNRTLVLTEEKL